jgi:hypothetical protein
MPIDHIVKAILIAYIALVLWVNPKTIAALAHPLAQFMWVVAAITIFMLYDVVLGILIAVAYIVTMIHVGKSTTPHSMPAVKMSQAKTPEAAVVGSDEGKQEDDATIEVPPNGSQMALAKYTLDDYLVKAADSGILSENFDSIVNPLGVDMTAQGIEKSSPTGYNTSVFES